MEDMNILFKSEINTVSQIGINFQLFSWYIKQQNLPEKNTQNDQEKMA